MLSIPIVFLFSYFIILISIYLQQVDAIVERLNMSAVKPRRKRGRPAKPNVKKPTLKRKASPFIQTPPAKVILCIIKLLQTTTLLLLLVEKSSTTLILLLVLSILILLPLIIIIIAEENS